MYRLLKWNYNLLSAMHCSQQVSTSRSVRYETTMVRR